MIRLSVVIITFNEEKNIARCLDSVLSIADEIIVLDSFSTDRTEQICREKNVKFFQYKFDGHIEQKNRAITYSNSPYILSLDADEAIDAELKAAILAAKSDWKFDAYAMNRLTNYCGKWIKHCGWYPDKKLRLWDSRKGKWAGINPHDSFVMNDESNKTGYLKGNILHYSYYTVDDHYKQVEYFTNISSQAYFKKGLRSNRLKMVFAPIIKFVRDYFLKLGFLDGSKGFTICRISAYATYLKYKKLFLLQNGKK